MNQLLIGSILYEWGYWKKTHKAAYQESTDRSKNEHQEWISCKDKTNHRGGYSSRLCLSEWSQVRRRLSVSFSFCSFSAVENRPSLDVVVKEGNLTRYINTILKLNSYGEFAFYVEWFAFWKRFQCISCLRLDMSSTLRPGSKQKPITRSRYHYPLIPGTQLPYVPVT